MLENEEKPVRFVGIDVHKQYLVATAVDADKNEVMPLRRVPLVQLDNDRVRKHLMSQDAVVREMTNNTWQFYDDNAARSLDHRGAPAPRGPHHSCPRHDRQARTLTRLHAAGLLPSVWVVQL
jgi:hypothetical protein